MKLAVEYELADISRPRSFTMITIDPHPPLHSLRVLDASRVLAGPFCGQILGDLGAEIIKLERPGVGDDTRGWGPPFLGELSAYFLSCNRNKRSLTLDISRPEGSVLFHQLVEKSDVLIENFRTDSAEHLGLTPEMLLERHPRLVSCSITGFGRFGPMREAPGYDFAIQAMSGLMSITGPREGPPCKVGVAVTDVLTGMYAAVAILACLRAREVSGHGYAIDLALLDCAIASQVNVAQAYLTDGNVPARQGNAHLQIVPYQLFATSDDWIVLNVGNDSQWQHFCEAADAPRAGKRFAFHDELESGAVARNTDSTCRSRHAIVFDARLAGTIAGEECPPCGGVKLRRAFRAGANRLTEYENHRARPWRKAS